MVVHKRCADFGGVSLLLLGLRFRGGAGGVDTIASPKSSLRRLTADTQRLCDFSPRVVCRPRLLDHLGQDRPRLDLDGRQGSDGNQGFLGDPQQVGGFSCCLAEVQRVDRVSITGTFGHRLRLLPIAGVGQEQIELHAILPITRKVILQLQWSNVGMWS